MEEVTNAQVKQIADAIHEALVEVFRIPENDRFQVVTRHKDSDLVTLDAGLGFTRIGSPIVIQILTQAGRSATSKQLLYKRIAERLADAGFDSSAVFIGYAENSPEDWSFGFGRAQYLTGELNSYNS